MSIPYEIEVMTQGGFYSKEDTSRKLKVYFSVPDNGINEDTGLLLLISGFGSKSSSNVYKKMRDKFADKYNLVTIQCDYFGYEFMQSTNKVITPTIDKNILSGLFNLNEMEQIYKNDRFDLNEFIKLGKKYKIKLEVDAQINENIDNFNDMGLLQSIDNITSLLKVMSILYNNNYSFNSKKVIIYGHSHGAYLSYLCNAFAPGLFSMIIDNSAWLYPIYLENDIKRNLISEIDNLTIIVKFDYLAKKIIKDKEILNLNNIYSNFHNDSIIVSYHGTSDELVSCKDKKTFCEKVNNCTYVEINEPKVDNIIFKSTKHGLDSDFIKLFDYTMDNFDVKFEKGNRFDLPNQVVFQTSQHKYIIDYEDIIPKINII